MLFFSLQGKLVPRINRSISGFPKIIGDWRNVDIADEVADGSF